MRRSLLTTGLLLAALAVAASLSVPGAGAVSDADPAEVLSIENAQGTFRVAGSGYLNMRVAQGSVNVVDQSPNDRYSPFLGGIPRGRSSRVTGREINLYVLGGRYKVIVRGSGINISARGDGVVVLSGSPDAAGNAGTIRIGDLVQPIVEGDAKATFGRPSSADGSRPGSRRSNSESSSTSDDRS